MVTPFRRASLKRFAVRTKKQWELDERRRRQKRHRRRIRINFLAPSVVRVSLPENTSVSQRVTAGLRVDAKAMRALAYGNLRDQVTVTGVYGVDLRVVTTRQPQYFAIGGHASHIRTTASR